MAKSVFEIEGFDELNKKIKQLPDKVKRREVLKILGQAANPTVKAAKSFTPVSRKAHIQKRSGQSFGTVIAPGTGRRSVGKKIMRKAANPMLYVSHKSTRKNDGWYIRQFVIPGTKHQAANPIIEKAYAATKGLVTLDAEKKVAKYVQKQINRLSS